MSTIMMSLCWPIQIPPTPKAVLISLADNANDDGYCWPSMPFIAKRTCFSERAVQKAVLWLEEHGFLQVDRGNGRHNSYMLTPKSGSEPQHDVHPSTTFTPEPRSPTTAPRSPHHSTTFAKPQHEVPSNRNRTINEPSLTKDNAFDARTHLLELGVDAQVVDDWLAMRKKKRAVPSRTAIDAIVNEVVKHGLGLQECLVECCARSWTGFKAEWVQPQVASGSRHAPSSGKTLHQRREETARAMYRNVDQGGDDGRTIDMH